MAGHWTLNDIPWEKFEPTKVDPEILAAVKAASLVEGTAEDYVSYLSQVFEGDAKTIALFEEWGAEELQHGRALARWAQLADPSFDFEGAVKAFKAGYRPEHFDTGVPRRGTRQGEMVSRCIVEVGTSSYYSAMKEFAAEPVLKEIAARIAADEFKHYKLFFETLHQQSGKPEPVWRRLMVALGRASEAEDDELGYAYYCGNTPLSEIGRAPYDRKASIDAYRRPIALMFRKHHVKKAAQMIAKAVGLSPQGWLVRAGAWFIWQRMHADARAA
ncbi:MAG: ferritin-like domain-containing protein [Alphaproteobacteria bacterium]